MGLFSDLVPSIRIFSDPPQESSDPDTPASPTGGDPFEPKSPIDKFNSIASSSTSPGSARPDDGSSPTLEDGQLSRQRSMDPLSSMILRRVGTDGQHSLSSAGAASSATAATSHGGIPGDPSGLASRTPSGSNAAGIHLDLTAPGSAAATSPASPTSPQDRPSYHPQPRQSLHLAPPTQSRPGGDPLSRSKSKRGGVFSILRKSSGRPTQADETDVAMGDKRDEGWNAHVFGYVPEFPTPPKYIRVRAHRKTRREMSRVFLSQQLSAGKIGAIWCAKFSKDGRYLATAGEDKMVRVWQVISFPEERDELEDSDEESGDDNESFLGDGGGRHHGRHFRRAGDKKRVSAPVFRPKPIRVYAGHSSDILDISWSKNNFLLSSSMDKTVRLWHLDRTDALCTFHHSDFVTGIRFHPKDDRFFLSGSLDCQLRLWSIPDREVAYTQDVPDLITAVAFSPDGSTAIAGCFGGQCLFYDTDGLHLQSQIHVRSSRGRNSKGSKITGIDAILVPRKSPHYNYSHGGEGADYGDVKILVSTNDSRIRIYDLHSKAMEAKFKGHENEQSQISASFSDDSQYIISGSEDERTYIWRTDADRTDAYTKKKDVQDYEYFHSNKSMVTIALFAPVLTKRILAVSDDPIYDLCDPPPVTLRPPSEYAEEAVRDDGLGQRKFPSLRPETKKSRHPDGNIIVTTDSEGVIKVFRQDCAFEARRQLLESSTMQKRRINGITLSPTPSWRESLSIHRTKSSIGSGRAPSPGLRFPPRMVSSEKLNAAAVASPLSDSSRQKLQPPSGTTSGQASPTHELPNFDPRRATIGESTGSPASIRGSFYGMRSNPGSAQDLELYKSVAKVADERPASDDLRCPNCQGTEFRAKKVGPKLKLACVQCGTLLD